jgi:hypothetical protein
VDAALGFHVGDGVRALRRLQMADVSRGPRSRCGTGSPACARLSARLARDGCDSVSERDRSPCPAAPIRVDDCRAQDHIRRDAELGSRPRPRCRSTHFWPAGSAWSV